jgi:hypothetical protein
MPLRFNELGERWPGRVALQAARLFVEPTHSLEAFVVAELSAGERRPEDRNCGVVDFRWHRIGMPIFAAMSQRKTCRIGKATGRTVNHLGNHRERTDGASTETWYEEQFRKVVRTDFGRRGEGTMEAPNHNISCPRIMMGWHDEMRQKWLLGRMLKRSAAFQEGELADDPRLDPNRARDQAGHIAMLPLFDRSN